MNIITVDDERFALLDIQQAVESAVPECTLFCFAKPGDAFEYAKENTVDVAFLDIEMGGMSGLELAKRLKDIYPATNIVFVTGYSEYALDAFSLHASGYIMKPITVKAVAEAIENLRNPIVKSGGKGLQVQAFGNFDVFVDGKPLCFPRSKSKELFAYLIHKRGASCNAKEIAAVLFEDKEYNMSLQKQVQTIQSAMLKTLKEAGFREIIIKTFNSTAVDVAKINCDYYRFLNGDSNAVNEYMGEYMSNYYWAEFTIGFLDRRSL